MRTRLITAALAAVAALTLTSCGEVSSAFDVTGGSSAATPKLDYPESTEIAHNVFEVHLTLSDGREITCLKFAAGSKVASAAPSCDW